MDWGTYLARGGYRPIYHMCDSAQFHSAMSLETGNGVYYPPTYSQDGFIHATVDPRLLIDIANHFYKSSTGDWILVEISVPWLDCSVIYEAAMPVGDKDALKTDTEAKFPHIYGGIRRQAVVKTYSMTRSSDGTFIGFENFPEVFSTLKISS